MAWSRRLMFVCIAGWCLAACESAWSDPVSQDREIVHLTAQLAFLPKGDLRPLRRIISELFGNADESQLIQLAEHPNWNVAMWARWELRRTSLLRAFDIHDDLYPLRFLELKGIAIPPAWAKDFATHYFLTDLVESRGLGGLRFMKRDRHDPKIKELYRKAIEYYETPRTSTSKIVSLTTEPGTFVHYTHADVPKNTTVTESDAELIIEQDGRTVSLKKPLTQNAYLCAFVVMGEDAFLPLLTTDRTFVVNIRGCYLSPFELTCFDGASGAHKWEAVGWGGRAEPVTVVPPNSLGPYYESIFRRTIVGEILPPDERASIRDGQQGQFVACSLYLTANDGLVTVFGSHGDILSVEVFDATTGRNLVRLGTQYTAEPATEDDTAEEEGTSEEGTPK